MLLLIALACTKPNDTADTEPPTSTVDPATVTLNGPCPMASDHGGLQVGSSGVEGSVADGVVPISILEEVMSIGECKLLRRNNPYCDPGCEPGTTCDWDGECVPYPANQDLGTLTIRGLANPVAMEPVFPGNTYFDTSLPDPPYTPGELVTLEMPGGVYGPATLYGVGVEPLVALDEEWLVEGGRDLVVHWEPPTGDVVRSEVAMSLTIDLHGVTPGSLACVFEDDGEGHVSGEILAELVSAGVTGFPFGDLDRRTVDSATAGEGCMDFTISNLAEVEVDVVGFTPCVADEDCPEGLTCNIEFQICE
jgi:hypothetical protein